MLKVSFLEFIMRGIPESLLFFLAAYAFTKNKIQLNKYLISAILVSVTVYLIRFLPIQNGADSILNLFLIITALVIINKFDIIQSIKAGIAIMLLEFMCEGVNIFFLQFILEKDLNSLFRDPMLKIIYNIPSLLLFGCIAIVYYIILWKRKELKYIVYGKVNQ